MRSCLSPSSALPNHAPAIRLSACRVEATKPRGTGPGGADENSPGQVRVSEHSPGQVSRYDCSPGGAAASKSTRQVADPPPRLVRHPGHLKPPTARPTTSSESPYRPIREGAYRRGPRPVGTGDRPDPAKWCC